MLKDLLSKLPPHAADPAFLVGFETGDDAAVYKINDEQGVVATTDFFMPIVDDPYDYGRIAATNALSDVYAVGGKPIMALAIAGFPVDKMSQQQMQQILAGGTKLSWGPRSQAVENTTLGGWHRQGPARQPRALDSLRRLPGARGIRGLGRHRPHARAALVHT